MKQLSYFAVVLAAVAGLWPIDAQTRPAVALEAAMTKEQVDGDLSAAMAAYQKIAADAAAPREIRAKALLRLAGCYEKLGKLAQSVYQQIVREFGDLPAADQARARLAAFRLSQPSEASSLTQRKIEIPGGSFRPQATDGRRMVYRNDATGELIYSDAATKTSRVIFKAKPGDVPDWTPSRDFSMVALHFEKTQNRPPFVAIVQTDGKGYRELIRDDEQGTAIGESGGVLNWSWDNRYLLMRRQQGQEPRQVLVVSTATGERSSLITQENAFFDHCAFSPDGRFVACKYGPDLGNSSPSRIVVLPAQGGESRLVREEADPYLSLLDWTDDGRYLAIGSARTGKAALHLLPIKDGRSSGEPILVQSGIYERAFTTKTGTLVYQKPKPGGLWTIHTALLDADGRPGNWQKLERPGENPTNPWPQWSPDSNQIVYNARDVEGEFGNSVVRVRNFATGKDREVYRSPGHIVCVWGAREAKIICAQWKETTAILSILPDTGQVERIGGFPIPAVLLYRSGGDDQSLHLWRVAKGKVLSSRWEIATGKETILNESEDKNGAAMVSADDRRLVQANGHQIEMKLIGGGDWKTLAITTTLQSTITRDGTWVFFHSTDPAGTDGLYRVLAAGGVPERVGSFPSHAHMGTIDISPDGRRIVTASYDYENGFELWTLDNIVPAANKQLAH